MTTWFATAPRLATPVVEVAFLVSPDFYFGPDRYPDVAERKQVEPLRRPACLEPEARAITSTQAAAHLDQLVDYYSDVVKAARKHGMDLHRLRHYFWMRLGIFSEPEKVYFGFPWLDSLDEIGNVLQSLASTSSQGEIHSDMDQGWEIQIHADADFFYLQESDPDAGEVHATAKVPRPWLSQQATETLHRTRDVVARLADALKDDAWTDHRTSLSFQRLILP